jgi:class I fructose-bisphosphate aldolase
VTAYAAHIAALLGAHIVKVKLPTDHVSQAEARKVYDSQKIDVSTQEARVRHVVQACLGGRRIVVFSGGRVQGRGPR